MVLKENAKMERSGWNLLKGVQTRIFGDYVTNMMRKTDESWTTWVLLG